MRRKHHLPQTFANIPVCLYVSVPSNLCKHWNHTCLSIFPCTLQPLQPLQPYLFAFLCTSQPLQLFQLYLSVYMSLYLATFVTFPSIPVCLSVSVPRNLCNFSNYTCLSICLCTSQRLQILQPYRSVYLSLYLATVATLPWL